MPLRLYNALWYLLWPVYRLLALVHPRARAFAESRAAGRAALEAWTQEYCRNSDRRFPAPGPAADDPQGPIWLHGASVGEVDQCLALAREIRARPGGKSRPILLSAFSLSVRPRELPEVDLCFHLPLDTPRGWRRIVSELRPAAFVTMTWDVFPNLLRELHRVGTSTHLGSAALAADAWQMKPRWRRMLRPIYAHFDGIGAVDAQNAKRFAELAPPERVQITGDTRYDQVLHKVRQARLDPAADARFQAIAKRGPLWILASTYAACDAVVLPAAAKLLERHPDLQLAIFPHKIDAERLAELEAKLAELRLDSASERLSELRSANPRRAREGKANGKSDPKRILVVDELGLLALVYRHGAFAYVGGGLHHRIHNTAEPAALGLPVLTGPSIDTSPVALALEGEGALLRCADRAAIEAAAGAWLRDRKLARKLGQRARDFLESEAGAARRTCDAFLEDIVGPAKKKTRR